MFRGPIPNGGRGVQLRGALMTFLGGAGAGEKGTGLGEGGERVATSPLDLSQLRRG